MRSTQKITLCGISCALSVICLLASVFPYATYSLAALAGLVFLPIVLELGLRYGVMCYVVTGLLSLIVTPDPEAKLLFVFFFGYYPIVHLKLSVWTTRIVSWTVKTVLFNVAVLAAFALLVHVIGIPLEEFYIGEVNLSFVLLILGNFVFILYDVALGRLCVLYRTRWHRIIKRFFIK